MSVPQRVSQQSDNSRIMTSLFDVDVSERLGATTRDTKMIPGISGGRNGEGRSLSLFVYRPRRRPLMISPSWTTHALSFVVSGGLQAICII